jgi:hypothetical protein
MGTIETVNIITNIAICIAVLEWLIWQTTLERRWNRKQAENFRRVLLAIARALDLRVGDNDPADHLERKIKERIQQ